MKYLISNTLFFLFSASVVSQPVQVELELVASGFTSPVDIVHAGDERLFIVEQPGTIRILNSSGEINETPFLDITDLVYYGGERGLLGLAFHPEYQNNGLFFINYTQSDGNTIIARYEVSEDPDIANRDSGSPILEIQQPASNHNGGDLEFGPDGYLYIGMGDGGGGGDPGNNAQNRQLMLGKMLRIDINADTYLIPETNPFTDDGSTLDEIWAIGLRNPWRFSFDRETGDLWIADVGQNEWEEINFQSAESQGGENYGWRCYEGDHPYNTTDCQDKSFYDFPVYEYDHTKGCSVTGGRVYRGEEFPLLTGHYFFADYCSGLFRSLKPKEGTFEEYAHETLDFGITSFGENSKGEIFIVNGSTGNMYKITEHCSSIIPEITSDGEYLNANVEGVNYQWYFNGTPLEGEENQLLEISGNGNYHVVVTSGVCENVSEIFTVNITGLDDQNSVTAYFYPNPLKGGAFNLVWDKKGGEATVSLYQLSGEEIYVSSIILKTGDQQIQIKQNLPAGSYLIKIEQEQEVFMGRLIVK